MVEDRKEFRMRSLVARSQEELWEATVHCSQIMCSSSKVFWEQRSY